MELDDRIKILMVDDMPPIRRIVKMMLKKIGLTNIDEAEDGQVAWEKVEGAHREGDPYHLVISDWNMPEMTGLDLLLKIKSGEVPDVQETPVIMLTCEVYESQVRLALEKGAKNYISKPFDMATLHKKVQDTLEKWAKLS